MLLVYWQRKKNISKLFCDLDHDLQLLLDDVDRQHPQPTVRGQNQPLGRDEVEGLPHLPHHLLLALHPGPGHGDGPEDDLGVLEEREQGQVVVSLRILYGDFVKAQGVNLGSQQVVVGLRGLQVLVSVQLVRVAAAQVNSLQSQTGKQLVWPFL